ncbi:hypothetical protein MMC11_003204 [Xylographa trunciseda]|nr:hypothetical protein [Xylographa trunciseda]
MAFQQLPLRLRPMHNAIRHQRVPHIRHQGRRSASTDLPPPHSSLSSSAPPPTSSVPSDTPSASLTSSSHNTPYPTPSQIASYDPIARARARKTQLPPSRYRFRPPKYDRGPLHPHRPPPASSPSSRLFFPGPFSLPRLAQTYTSTLRPDLMTLHYNHIPPGTPRLPTPQRLRSWEGASPYYANRPLRKPRGASQLPLLAAPVTYRTVPAVSRITVSSVVHQAAENSAYLHVAGMVLQAMTGQRAGVHLAKKSLVSGKAALTQRAGKPISLSVDVEGEAMWHLLGTLVELVGPGIKEWKGLRGSSGDGSGNMGLSLDKEVVGAWPEIEVNYDSYPPHMIPGVYIIIHTTATNDRDARLLLGGTGLPFYGKHRN